MGKPTKRNAPHFDVARTTLEGQWLTACRIAANLRQSDIAAALGRINPQLDNLGRVSELETGKRPMTTDVKAGLYAEFRKRLGDNCPAPP